MYKDCTSLTIPEGTELVLPQAAPYGSMYY